MKIIYLLLFSTFLFSNIIAKDVSYISIDQICLPKYTYDAILRKDNNFISDFLILHSLIKILQPDSFFEIGTCTGEGTLIIKNALGDKALYSLELPIGQSSYDIQQIGGACNLPYTQLIGNSLSYDYKSCYPIDSWFIDGAHDYLHVFFETQQAVLSEPKFIVWHDADIPEVFQAIQDGLEDNNDYFLFRVPNTRIAFSVHSSNLSLLPW